jgi:hypothetical protein
VTAESCSTVNLGSFGMIIFNAIKKCKLTMIY